MRAIYVLVDEEDYLELRKRLLEERKSLAQWVRERIKEYLKGAPEDRNTDDKAPSGK
jgi:transposase